MPVSPSIPARLFMPCGNSTGKTEEGRFGKVKGGKSGRWVKSDVDCAQRFSGIPVLTGGDDGKQAADQRARTSWVFKMQEDVSSEWHVIAAQDKALNIGFVELTHFVRQS